MSDLHLHSEDLATFEAWASYLDHTAADAVFMLGDLFEVWVGDDILTQADSFELRCAEVIRRNAGRLSVCVMHGNRDFLMGPTLMEHCNATLLSDPFALEFAGQRWLLAHGDTYCLDDTAYQAFRSEVRSTEWQANFLAQPLQKRIEVAREIRNASERQKSLEGRYASVANAAVIASLREHGAFHMIHGHTHQPADHALGGDYYRHVLSDWDILASHPRAEVFRINATENSTFITQRISPTAAATSLR